MTIMRKIGLFSLLFAGLLTACSKELSEETGTGGPIDGGTAEGTLAGSPGACANILVNGVYGVGLPLSGSDNLEVDLNITQAGTYGITTDTVNGMYFTGGGTAAATGTERVILTGNGTPLAAGQFTFTVKFKTSSCSVLVQVYEVAIASNGDYFPLTANSRWTYLSSAPGADPSDTLLSVSTGQTGTIGSLPNPFNLVVLDFGQSSLDSAFYRKNNGEYYEFGDLDLGGFGDDFSAGEYIFLKDNVPAGTEWLSTEVNNAISGAPVKFRLKHRVTAKDVRAVIDGKVFQNVIKVTVTQQSQLSAGGPWTDVLAYDTWFAKGIGLVNVVAPSPLFGYRVIKYTVF